MVWQMLGAWGLAYLIGSLPFAVWISRGVYGQDIRNFGSGNAGSTNMYRTFGFKAGFITQLLDVLKGVAAALLPVLLPALPETLIDKTLHQLICGSASVLGHTFPVLAGFRGGKGINTILGMMLAIHPIGSLAGLLTFGGVMAWGRMVSLASMCAVSSFPIFLLVKRLFFPATVQPGETLLLFAGTALAIWVIYTHRQNIARIRAGNERKVTFGKKTAEKTR